MPIRISAPNYYITWIWKMQAILLTELPDCVIFFYREKSQE
ncbi:hypothetical protein RUMGNA_00330 [Mediterraneibacter gnavus ATCC 29149]|uniref:Uncharacterized protein n=1 Tax=Mediterraneibacter gnavus (strain ATCC 29149 / DSM 114966 / JCM 6515 / VPI C7-9) TaxID=411470 RepID=A7AYG5_MEDG7|nr:hypothetical protein RUMGNA_00330 [Mediterraneibacter gnavus ATCC 29149]